MEKGLSWPGTKRFAPAAFDDTDRATLASVATVCAFLADLGYFNSFT